MIRNISKNLLVLDRAIEAIKRDLPPDPLMGLPPKQNALVKRYRESTDPLDQWLNILNEVPTPEVLLVQAGLDTECTEIESQIAYQREFEKFNSWYSRRKKRVAR